MTISKAIKNEQTRGIFDYISGRVDEDSDTPILDIDNNGTILYAEGQDPYAKVLNDNGFTLEQVKQLQEVNGAYITASTAAGGAVAENFLRENTDMESVLFEFPMGYDTHTIQYDRSGEVTNITQVPMVNDNGDLKAIKESLVKMFSSLPTEDSDEEA